MFTGIIHGQGEIVALEARGGETRLRIQALYSLENIVKGESIATNGTCLTVESFGHGWFTAYASKETMRVTSLGQLRMGSRVNLERALAVGDRLGGHLVSGHVDCVATVANITPQGVSKCFRLEFPEQFGVQVIPKGSVTLDGISLTVNHCGPNFLEVNIIPETQHVTTIGQWTIGRHVNMETDIIGKYVQRMVSPFGVCGTAGASASEAPASSGGITMEFLRKNGF